MQIVFNWGSRIINLNNKNDIPSEIEGIVFYTEASKGEIIFTYLTFVDQNKFVKLLKFNSVLNKK